LAEFGVEEIPDKQGILSAVGHVLGETFNSTPLSPEKWLPSVREAFGATPLPTIITGAARDMLGGEALKLSEVIVPLNTQNAIHDSPAGPLLNAIDNHGVSQFVADFLVTVGGVAMGIGAFKIAAGKASPLIRSALSKEWVREALFSTLTTVFGLNLMRNVADIERLLRDGEKELTEADETMSETPDTASPGPEMPVPEVPSSVVTEYPPAEPEPPEPVLVPEPEPTVVEEEPVTEEPEEQPEEKDEDDSGDSAKDKLITQLLAALGGMAGAAGAIARVRTAMSGSDVSTASRSAGGGGSGKHGVIPAYCDTLVFNAIQNGDMTGKSLPTACQPLLAEVISSKGGLVNGQSTERYSKSSPRNRALPKSRGVRAVRGDSHSNRGRQRV
jgi:hypothetical protein